MPGSVPLQQCPTCGTLHEYRVACPFCAEVKDKTDMKVTKEMIKDLLSREKDAK